MIVLGCTAGTRMAEGVARALDVGYVSVNHKIFPDGESYVRVSESVKGEDVLIVQSLGAPQEKHFFELLEAVDGAKNAGAAHIFALLPYLAYARQDRVFTTGEPVSARIVLEHLKHAGVEKIAVVNPHKSNELSYFKGDSLSIDATPYIAAEAIKRSRLQFVLAPDEGAAETARGIAEAHSLKWGAIDKERSRTEGSIKIRKAPKIRFDGKKVLIVDDMISTGGTVAQTARFAKENGAASVSVAAVHLLLAGNAYDLIRSAGVDEIFGTNSIEESRPGCIIFDISKLVAEKLSDFL